MAVDVRACFDQLLLRAREIFKPEPDEMVWEWAQRKIVIPTTESEISGPFRAALTPYIKEPLECYRIRGVNQCTFMVATQTFKTLCNIIGVLWYCDHEDGRIIWPWDNETNARRFSKTRWKRMIDASPELQYLIPANRHDYTNLEQDLGGCLLRLMGSHSAGNIASEPADLVVAEEVEKMAVQGEKETDAVSNVKSRGKSRSRRRQFFASSPTTEAGLINRSYEEGDQRKYFMPCPYCGEFILFEWTPETVRWDKSAKDPSTSEWDMNLVQSTAAYYCQRCEGIITNELKISMLQNGEWRPTNLNAPSWCRSYQMSSMYSPWESCNWGNLAIYYLTCLKTFNMKDWDNNYMGLPTAEVGEGFAVDVLQRRRKKYEKEIPDRAAFLTISVDTQGDRLEAECIAWGEGTENWGIEYRIFHAATKRDMQDNVWTDLEEWIWQDWGLPLAMVFVDIGGHHGTEVARFVKKHRARNCFAIQGARKPWSRILSGVSKTRSVKPRVAIVNIGTDNAKNQWLAMLEVEDPGKGYCHFPTRAAGYDDEYFRQLGAEEKKPRYKAGKLIWKWEKTRQRNEALDIRVYGLAAYYFVPDGQKEAYFTTAKKRSNPLLEKQNQPASRPNNTRPPKRNFSTGW